MKRKATIFLLLVFLVFAAGVAFGEELIAGVGTTGTSTTGDTKSDTYEAGVYGISSGGLTNYQAQAFTQAVSSELNSYISLLQQGGLTAQEQQLVDMANAFKGLLPQYQELWGVVKTGTPLYFASDGTVFTTNIQDQWIYNTPAIYLGSGSALLCTWSQCFFNFQTGEGSQFYNAMWSQIAPQLSPSASTVKVGDQTVLHVQYSDIGQTTTAGETETGITSYNATMTVGSVSQSTSTQSVVTDKGGNQIGSVTQTSKMSTGTKTVAGQDVSDKTYTWTHTVNYDLLGQTSTKNTVSTSVTYNYNYFDEGCTAFCSSPLVLDMDGNSKLEASQGKWEPHPGHFDKKRVAPFDFFGNGFPVVMEWVGPNDGLLCVPKSDGSIDGTCLFGVAEGFPDGFSKLSLSDKNGDGKLTGDELSGLFVWQDLNQNAKPDAGEVKSASELGITQINTTSQKGIGVFVMNGKSRYVFDWWPTMADTKKVKNNQ